MRVDALLPAFAAVFDFERFNAMQAAVIPTLLETPGNVVVAAPTASGKTAVAEAAICQQLDRGETALFIAPLRALTNEKEAEWDRFEALGYAVYVVTGERDVDPARAAAADVLVMTPEKVDSATRKPQSPRYRFMRSVGCVVIDEVHLLDADGRGPVLEVTVARLRRQCDPRIIALSATMQNIDDVAAWLDAPDALTFRFDAEARPVPLEATVTPYSAGENSFADKYRRLYKAIDAVEPHLRADGQALVFVASRRDAVQAALKAREVCAERGIRMGARGELDVHEGARALETDELRGLIPDGVAFHHAGLSRRDRDQVEAWFREGTIDLLVSTSTLAWGVNLPARCVVIRDTKYHDPLAGEVDISPLDVLQMIGRAGRPGYDDAGYGWVIAPASEATQYRRLLADGRAIESRLLADLDVHLNAEVAIGTIRSRDDLAAWVRTTFLHHRAGAAPERYSEPAPLTRAAAICDRLIERGFMTETDQIAPTELGRLTSDFYLRLATAERFHRLATGGRIDTGRILATLAAAAEFASVSERSAEQSAIETVLSAVDADEAVGHRKVLAILHAAMGDAIPAALRADAWIIRQNALRLVAALGAILETFAGPAAANRARRVAARIEHGVDADAVGLTAIDGVGARRARTLAGAGLDDPAAVATADLQTLTDLEIAAGTAERIQTAAAKLPAVSVAFDAMPGSIAAGATTMAEATVTNHGGPAAVGIAVTVNGTEMTATECYLRESVTLPVGVFGAETRSLRYRVTVSFPALPLGPVTAERVVHVDAEAPARSD